MIDGREKAVDGRGGAGGGRSIRDCVIYGYMSHLRPGKQRNPFLTKEDLQLSQFQISVV